MGWLATNSTVGPLRDLEEAVSGAGVAAFRGEGGGYAKS